MSITDSESSAEPSDQVWTIPNALSVLRLLGVPLFLWLLLGPKADLWAFAVLAIAAITDWADGKLARMLGQTSKLGTLLDPAADRLYILATLIAFLIRGIVPWWVVAVLILRDIITGLALLVLRRHRYQALQVHYLGKAATFCLLYAFPLLLLANGDSTFASICRPIAYAFMIWGGALYVWAGVIYVMQVNALVQLDRQQTTAVAERTDA